MSEFFDFCEGFSRELRELREWAARHNAVGNDRNSVRPFA